MRPEPRARRDTAALRLWAYVCAALALLSALVSAYWAAGGTALLATVGGQLEQLGRQGGGAVVAVLLLVVLVKLAGLLLGLALAHPGARWAPARLVEGTALVGGTLLAVYGGVLVAVGALALTGVFGVPVNRTAMLWHVLFWDPWFLLWGTCLLAAVVCRRRLRGPRGLSVPNVPRGAGMEGRQPG